MRYSLNSTHAKVQQNRFKERLVELRAQHGEAQAQGIDLPPIDEDVVWEEVCDERIIKLLDTHLAPLEKSSKKLEKIQRAAEKAKKARLKHKEWNEAYANYYKKTKASSSSKAIPPPPPPPPMESDEEHDDDEDEDDTEDYRCF
ncbi:hypothetical protein PIB30_008434 [Stylosanthes scabra]|uniref:Uncharacterized protein n=1 Tax=Stylosanthes scabra TaxID=79078 RepID=A0ABU6W2Z0_9FABA|nr:hypothetical protein [Stylosanthes scabra]